MPEESVFRGIIHFFDRIGVYDVILPFILVFTIMFAIFEKTRVLGEEKVGDNTYSKRNLNSMASFVIAFLVVASSQLVALINEALANVVVLILVSVSFLMLMGLFHGTGEIKWHDKPGMTAIMILMSLGVILIFMHAIPVEDTNVLSYVLEFVSDNWQADWVGAIILIILVVGFMIYIQGPDPHKGNSKKE
jgi:hypothetical protein